MSGSGTFPAITASIGGKQRRLTLERQWRRAITNGDLQRETPVHLQLSEEEGRMCSAQDCPQLALLFDELKGPLEPEPAAEPEAAPEPDNANENAAGTTAPVSPGLTADMARPARRRTFATPAPAKTSPSFGTGQHYSAPDRGRQARPQPVDDNPLHYMIAPLLKYGEFSGRARPAEYWWYYLALVVAYFAATLLLGEVGLGLLWLGTIVPTLAVTVRRLHDSNLSGWLVLGLAIGLLIPVVNLLVALAAIILMCLPGTDGPNPYGPDPKAAG